MNKNCFNCFHQYTLDELPCENCIEGEDTFKNWSVDGKEKLLLYTSWTGYGLDEDKMIEYFPNFTNFEEEWEGLGTDKPVYKLFGVEKSRLTEDPIVNDVISRMMKRSAIGMKKYGHTMVDAPETTLDRDWETVYRQAYLYLTPTILPQNL